MPDTKNLAATAVITPLSKLTLDPANLRVHDERSVAAIQASLVEHGQLKPIVVQQKGMKVVAGNGMVAAALQLEWTSIAAVVVKGMTDKQATSFAIADNRTSELSEWDDRSLAELLAGWDEDAREAAGFNEKEMETLLASIQGWSGPNTNPDQAGRGPVTEGELDRAGNRLDARFDGDAGLAGNLMDICCPHCAEVFQIPKPER